MAKKIETALVQAGRNDTKAYGYVNPKLVRGSTVLYPDMATKRQHRQAPAGAGGYLRDLRQRNAFRAGTRDRRDRGRHTLPDR